MMDNRNIERPFEAAGKLLYKLITDYSYDISSFAKELGVSKVSVSQWIKGKQMSIKHICQITEFFQITVEEFLNGKLHDEGTIDYLERNFDLSSFNLDELIVNKDIDGLKEYYRRCLSIKNRYVWLLEKWGDDSLNEDQKIEYEYLEKYIKLDVRLFGEKYHYDFREIRKNGEDLLLKQCVHDYFENAKDLDGDYYEGEKAWEIDKLIEYNIDLRGKDVIELGDEDLIICFLYMVNQQYRDELLALNLQDKDRQEIEDNKAIGLLPICGANCIYRLWHSPSITDDEIVELFEGDIVEDKEWSDAWEYCNTPGFNVAGRSQLYAYKDELKNYSYNEYKKTVMKKRTKYIEDLCNIKHDMPLVYYTRLKNGEYDDYLPNKGVTNASLFRIKENQEN